MNTKLWPDPNAFAIRSEYSDASVRADGRLAIYVSGGQRIPELRQAGGYLQVFATDVEPTDNATNYIAVNRDGQIVSNPIFFTDITDGDGSQRLYVVTVAAGVVTEIVDYRFWRGWPDPNPSL